MLQLGDRVTSKRLEQWLANCSADAHIRVTNHPEREDPTHRITVRYQTDLAALAAAVAAEEFGELDEAETTEDQLGE